MGGKRHLGEVGGRVSVTGDHETADASVKEVRHLAPKKAGKAIKARPGETRLVAGNPKMGPEELQERLREAAALGDAEEVRRLLAAGADVNSRNEIDGW